MRTAHSITSALGCTGSPGRLDTHDHRTRGHTSTPSSSTRDLPDENYVPTGTFRGALGIRKHAYFVYKTSCTVATHSAIHPAHFPHRTSVPTSDLSSSSTAYSPTSQITSSQRATINPSALCPPSPLEPIRVPLVTPVTPSSHLRISRSPPPSDPLLSPQDISYAYLIYLPTPPPATRR
jgi:hypothetical protein